MSTYDDSVGDVDIIFAGGGTAACVVAGRLAKADPSLKILLVEGGKNNYNDPTVVNPAVYLSHLAPTSSTALVSAIFSCTNVAASRGNLWILRYLLALETMLIPVPGIVLQVQEIRAPCRA